ncbi:hypothetical protein DL96DRAFT_1810823 [Flagelloscypha sp. PMI_526]|nr:hypothetical protein DL96DRAFT_1810823 [Flagelloscypha sp. PMI_526]
MAPRTRLAARLEAEGQEQGQQTHQPRLTPSPNLGSSRQPARKTKPRKYPAKCIQDSSSRPAKRRRTELHPKDDDDTLIPPSTPVLRLPFDLWHSIVSFLENPRVTVPPVLVMSQVCRTWRKYAFNSRNLWRRFQFTLPRPSKVNPRAPLPPKTLPMHAWIKKAKVFPTSASICVAPGSLPVALNPSIVKSFLPGVKQLRTLHLSLPLSTYTGFESASDTSFKSLEDLHIHVCSVKDLDAYKAGWNYPISAFRGASSLRRVKLTSFAEYGLLHQRGIAFHLPWSRLTDLTIKEGRVDNEACLNALYNGRCLERCTMNGIIAWPVDPRPLLHVSLPNLKILDVSFVGPGSAYPLFASISLPNLDHLTMTSVPAPGFVPDEFTARSCQRLRTFILHESGLDLLVESFITNMPRLHHLEISTNDLCLGADVYPLLVKNLKVSGPGVTTTATVAVTPPHVNILPNLETLVVTESYMFEPFYDDYDREKWKDDTLANVVASRWKEEVDVEEEDRVWEKFKRLKNVEVNYLHREMCEGAKRVLDGCKREGLDVEVNDNTRQIAS